jgi:hypothetical protein
MKVNNVIKRLKKAAEKPLLRFYYTSQQLKEFNKHLTSSANRSVILSVHFGRMVGKKAINESLN